MKFKDIYGDLSDTIYEGNFDCNNNNLTSLEGAPKEINGSFDCSNNNLTSLEGAPKEINGYFDCSNNNLTSLKDAPKKINGSFDCYNNNLTSLEGLSKYYKRFKSDFSEEEYLDFCKKRFSRYFI